jgi:hypothetical protein
MYSDGQTQNSRFWKSNINVCLSHSSVLTITSQFAVEVYHSVMYLYSFNECVTTRKECNGGTTQIGVLDLCISTSVFSFASECGCPNSV